MRFPYLLFAYAFNTSGEKVLPLFLKSVSYTAFARSMIFVIYGVEIFNFLPIYSIGTNPFSVKTKVPSTKQPFLVILLTK